MAAHLRYERAGLRMPKGIRIAMYGMLALCVAITVAVWVAGGEDTVDAVIATVVLLVVPLGCLAVRGRITVDEDALVLAVRPVFRKTIPLREVVAVRVGEVHPLRDFGGSGYRVRGGGRIGFVHEAGPSVEVTTEAGKTYTISDPAAERLAAVLKDGAGLG
ncbi:hypothetical protein EV191_109168 [Tamaricihabitans halophyticus]|uniref:PH (Pleckstrin Homology) domain-containing protein n=1 Tax=Tamaricihabitans halophyticus TaxID=1262583 RepID=A0A4V2ST43_9PSEU|nr:hypothetical protein [Tamaricihabitans halophyticus]TCP49346.1 hypothetical protein EV191_109168 [Tamaricihabitans halophyticus]